MKKLLTIFAALAVACVLVIARPAAAHDVDGPDDCQKDHIDFGDAPECIPAYPSGVIGKFPTCKAPCTLIGTQEFVCPPISIPPGPTGFVMHVSPPGSYWLGCYPTPAGPEGIDTDADGKVNVGGVGISACGQIPTDCVEVAFGGMPFDQDECYADGSDAGITTPIVFATCAISKVDFFTTSCFAAARQVYLNVCVDWNEDGDWNDNFQCVPGGGGGGGVGGCAYEWAVKNAVITLTPGCALMSSPPFLSGPKKGHSWLRISISDNPAPDDYPWNGTVSIGQFYNGETEDYPVEINDITTPSHGSTWGQLKIRYR